MDLPPLEADDLHHVLALLARLATSTEPVAVRKRQLAAGLAELIAADVWAWSCGGLPLALLREPVLGGGWKSWRQKGQLLRALEQRGWRELCRRAVVNGDPRAIAPAAQRSWAGANGRPRRPHLTRARRSLIDDEDWYDSAYYRAHHAPAGVDDFLLSAYPLGGEEWSTLMFWRRRGAPPFSERDRQVVHLVTAEIDGLHRLPNEHVLGNGDVALLSRRQHQVLRLLLAGDANKQIARKLKLSEHTVSDYMKALHARFKVHTRGQLLARFVAGAGAANGWGRDRR